MNKLRQWLVPFFCAFVACPAFIFLHELGHYAAGAALGFKVKLHYARVSGLIPKEKDTAGARILNNGAGPLVNAVLAGAGLLWLYGLRRHRREAAANLADWLATSLTLNAGRWLRGFGGPPGHPQPADEAQLSQALGLPAWFLPYLLALLAVGAVIFILRLHPRGGRLLPFLSAALGGVIGIQVWLRLAGPWVLP